MNHPAILPYRYDPGEHRTKHCGCEPHVHFRNDGSSVIGMCPASLSFMYQPSHSSEKANCGWGEGTLWLNGQAFWHGGGSPDAPQPLIWTWIDLLEHLAECGPGCGL